MWKKQLKGIEKINSIVDQFTTMITALEEGIEDLNSANKTIELQIVMLETDKVINEGSIKTAVRVKSNLEAVV